MVLPLSVIHGVGKPSLVRFTQRRKRDRRPAMPIRFWRRVRVAPGLRVNLTKSGASLSVGRRGAWYTIGPRGRRATVGLPGTGLFWIEHAPPESTHLAGRRLSIGIAFLVALVALALIVAFALG